MITQALFQLWISAIQWVLGLMPGWSPPDITGALTSIGDSRVWQYTAWMNEFVPLDTALLCVVVLLAVYIGYFGFEFGVWALTKLHLLGGDSS